MNQIYCTMKNPLFLLALIFGILTPLQAQQTDVVNVDNRLLSKSETPHRDYMEGRDSIKGHNQLFQVGAHWYCSRARPFIGGSIEPIELSIDSLATVDSIGEVYVLSDGGRKMYDQDGVWYVEMSISGHDTRISKFVKLMDFNARDSFRLDDVLVCEYPGDDTFHLDVWGIIDSIALYPIKDGQLIEVYYVRYKGRIFSGNGYFMDQLDYNTMISRGIGVITPELTGPFSLDFLFNTCVYDPIGVYEGIRCFSNDTVDYHFVDYPCDTVIIIHTNTPGFDDGSRVKILPNPSREDFVIAGAEGELGYKIMELSSGKMVGNGRTREHRLHIDKPGVYMVEMRSSKYLIRRKIIKL